MPIRALASPAECPPRFNIGAAAAGGKANIGIAGMKKPGSAGL
jgi:hypothetical protein